MYIYRTLYFYTYNNTIKKMKKTLSLLVFLLSSIVILAQSVEYQTFIYTSDDLADEIQNLCEERNSTRSYMGDLFNASKESVKGIASGYVTSFIDLGVNAIGTLLTRNSRLKDEWEETVRSENIYTTKISTVSEMNDFYKETSFDGALDPKGMRFDGIGCLRKDGNDTVFYISCHIDRNKINRIINHSKFELALDTLIICPTRSNLPNSILDIPFSFEERKNFCLSITMKLTSSWMNEIVQLQKDQELGEFSLEIPVDSSQLDKNGFFRYVRKGKETPKYKIRGESFIVPRSYMGFRDENDEYRISFGTGEYKLSMELKETCDITEQYRKNWKKDRKRRKEMEPSEDILTRSWQVVSSQQWNELTKQWVITTLKAPADIITKDVIDKLGFEAETEY